MSVNTPSLSPSFDIPLSSEHGSPTTRLELTPNGTPMLIVKRTMGWAEANAIRWDLEQVFDRNVFIAWDDE